MSAQAEDVVFVYRVVHRDGEPFSYGPGRGSDPFTRRGSARARATETGGKVQRARVVWEDDE